MPVPWRLAALPLATLFLNFPFWYIHGFDLPLLWPLPAGAALLAAVALLMTALFFIGPALAARASGLPWIGVLERSFGSMPAYGLRAAGALFLMFWMAKLTAWALLWLTRDFPPAEACLIDAAVLAFLFISGLQSSTTTAKLAIFTNKLAVALLLAASVRVHQGWPAVFHQAAPVFDGSQLRWGLAALSSCVAPVALLASGWVACTGGRRDAVRIGLVGIAFPLFGTLLWVAAIEIATFASPFYQPSLRPNLATALWGNAATSAAPGP